MEKIKNADPKRGSSLPRLWAFVGSVAQTGPPGPPVHAPLSPGAPPTVVLLYSCNPSPTKLRVDRVAHTPLSPHALHVHPSRPIGRTRIVWTSRAPVHSKGRFCSRRVVRSALLYSVDNLDNLERIQNVSTKAPRPSPNSVINVSA